MNCLVLLFVKRCNIRWCFCKINLFLFLKKDNLGSNIFIFDSKVCYVVECMVFNLKGFDLYFKNYNSLSVIVLNMKYI